MEIVLLDKKSTIAKLVDKDIDSQIVSFIENELASDEYNFIVSADNLKFAKDKMAELNKSISYIDTFRKDKVNEESIAIDAFKKNVKTYVELINAKRDELKQAVDKFELESKKLITNELLLYVDDVVAQHGIREEFNDVSIDDLITLGAITAKGSLTKKSRESIEGRVIACKSKQDKYDMRLMHLENLSYKAGLESPLTLTHVQGIIYLNSDAEYSAGIEKLLESELARQNTIKEKMKQKANEEAMQEARLQLQKEQNEIRNLFHNSYNVYELSIESARSKISELENYDFSIFGGNDLFAKSVANEHIEYLKKYEINALEKSKKQVENTSILVSENLKPEPLKDIPVVIETVPVEDGKKVVLVDVHLQFKVNQTIGNEKIVSKVNQMLGLAGFNESLIGVEVVS